MRTVSDNSTQQRGARTPKTSSSGAFDHLSQHVQSTQEAIADMSASIQTLINGITIVVSTLARNAEDREDHRLLFQALVAAQTNVKRAIEDTVDKNERLVADVDQIAKHQRQLESTVRMMVEEQRAQRQILRRVLPAARQFNCL